MRPVWRGIYVDQYHEVLLRKNEELHNHDNDTMLYRYSIEIVCTSTYFVHPMMSTDSPMHLDIITGQPEIEGRAS